MNIPPFSTVIAPWGSLKDKTKEIYLRGDALEPRKVKEAITEGFSIGLKV